MSFQLKEILDIIDHVKAADLALFEYQDADARIKIREKWEPQQGRNGEGKEVDHITAAPVFAPDKNENMPQKEREEAAPSDIYVQESLMVGTFYIAPSEDAEPFVRIGDTVKEGQTIGIIEAMKLMNEVSADCSGVVEAVMVHNEQTVEYGQPLIRIRREQE